MNVMNGPICRQVEYIIVSNNIMFMSLLAYMLRMLLVLAYMLRLMLVPMYMIHVASKLIVLIVNMHVVSAYANVWNFRINNQLICHEFVKFCPHKCSKLLN